MNEQPTTKLELIQEIRSLREAMKFQMDYTAVTWMETSFLAASPDAILLIDEAQHILQFNAAAEGVFGYPACDVIGKPVDFLLEGFREPRSASIRRFAPSAFALGNMQDLVTLSGRRANGEIFPLEVSIAPVRQDGRKFYFAILRDVSQRATIEGLLLRQYESLTSLHQITLALLSEHDIKKLLQFIVEEAAKLFDSPYCEILLPENGELVAKAFTPGTAFPAGNHFTRESAPLSWQVFDSGLPGIVGDYSEWDRHNNAFDPHHFHAAAAIPILVEESCIGVLGFARADTSHPFSDEDILSASRFAAIAALAMENSRLYQEIQLLAATDELTGTRSRRSLMEIGEREVKRSMRYARPLSLLMIDADRFKQINDSCGHPTGDLVLRGIAKQCMDQIRATDTVGRFGKTGPEVEHVIGRFGGEEFVILLPETTLEQAQIVAERIRVSIEKMQIAAPSDDQANLSTIQVTVSIGVASLQLKKDTLLELLARADCALYQAKASGRNRICVQD